MDNPNLNGSSVTMKTKAGKTVVVDVGNRLMKNHAPGTPVSPGQRFEVAEDGLGQPMILSLGNDHKLWLVYRRGDDRSGWSQVDLTGSLGKAQAFACSQAEDGLITLAISVEGGSDGKSQVYATAPLDPAKTDWTSFKAWMPRSGSNGAVKQLLIGPDGQGKPTLVAAVDSDKGSTYYLINLDMSVSHDLWTELPPPTDATSVIDVAMGRIADLGAGLYTLYHGNGGLQLVFTTYPIKVGTGHDKSLSRRLTAPPGAHDLGIGPSGNGTTELFVSGAGVWRFAPDNQGKDATAGQVDGTGDLGGVVEIIVVTDTKGNTALWSIAQDETLYYQLRASGQEGWSAPVPVHKGAGQIAAQRSSVRVTNELFVVDSDSLLQFLFQDAASTLWLTSLISTYDTGEIVESTTYTYQVSVTDPTSGMVPADLKLGISASDWSYATINGAATVLDGASSFPVDPDASGLVTVVFTTETMDVPSITLRSDGLVGSLTLDGGADLRARLAAMSAHDLESATFVGGKHVGEKVVGGNYVGNISAAKGSFDQLQKVSASLKGGPGAVSFAAGEAAPGEDWGVILRDGGATFHVGDEARSHLSARAQGGSTPVSFGGGDPFGRSIVAVAGDLLNALMKGLKKAASFFVQWADNVAWFFVEVGKELLRFELTSMSILGRAFSWALQELLGVDVHAALDWLGFVFDWADINRTHKALVNLTNQTIIWAEGQIGGLAGKVDAFFVDLQTKIKALGPFPANVGDQKVNSDAQEAAAKNPVASGALGKDPATGYSSYHVQHSGVLDAALPSVGGSDPLAAFIKDVLSPTAESIGTTFAKVWGDLLALFESNTLTFNQAIKTLGLDALLGLLDAARKVAVGLLTFMADAVEWARGLINAKVEIPFLSGLYKKYIGSDLTVLDAFALLLSIPGTILYKIFTGVAPVASDQDPLITMNASQLFAGFPPKGTAGAAAGPVAFGDGPTLRDNWTWLGGVVGCPLQFLQNVLTLVQAVTLKQMTGIDRNSPLLPKLRQRYTTIDRVNMVISLIGMASSVPVANYEGAASVLEYFVYGKNFVLLGVGFLCYSSERISQLIGEKVQGGLGIFGAIAGFALEFSALLVQIKVSDAYDLILTGSQDLFSDLSDGLGASAGLDPDPESKVSLYIGSTACSGIGGILQGLRVYEDISHGRPFHRFIAGSA